MVPRPAAAQESSPRRPLEILGQIMPWREMIEDFLPITESLRWRLADAYWMTRGVASFVDGKVPYVVNNDGRLSADAAGVLFANCQEHAPGSEGITVLELGAGCGLFARYFLDEFEDLCRRESRDFYHRLTYVVTDRSPATVAFWAANGIFDRHAGHVLAQAADAASIEREGGPIRAAFCHYVLDSLPGSILRRSVIGWEQLCSRTWIDTDPEILRQYTALSATEMIGCAGSGARLAELLPLLPLFQEEREFRSLAPGSLAEFDLPESSEPGQPFVYNHGAIRCLDALVNRLETGGFVMVSDYRPAKHQPQSTTWDQWFGPAPAMGLNFELLEEVLRHKWGELRVLTPDGDDELPIHSRLLHRSDSPAWCDAYRQRFSAAARQAAEAIEEAAHSAVAVGNSKEALRSFQAAIECNPRNWRLIGEAAEFVGTHLRDHARAAELARVALDLNPWYAAQLWNLRGKSLSGTGLEDEAHECHLRAERIQPNDPATQLHLAKSWLRRGRAEKSLQAIATGLANDSDSLYRHVLLDAQQEAVAALALRWMRERT